MHCQEGKPQKYINSANICRIENGPKRYKWIYLIWIVFHATWICDKAGRNNLSRSWELCVGFVTKQNKSLIRWTFFWKFDLLFFLKLRFQQLLDKQELFIPLLENETFLYREFFDVNIYRLMEFWYFNFSKFNSQQSRTFNESWYIQTFPEALQFNRI